MRVFGDAGKGERDAAEIGGVGSRASPAREARCSSRRGHCVDARRRRVVSPFEGGARPAPIAARQRGDAEMAETGLDKVKTVLRVTSGNFLEMYDFFLFGIYARQIAATFFPSDDPYASLMATFLSFTAGFAMRPIGALVLGPYIDRIGRRQGLLVTLSIMACGTILIAFVPGYATIGVLAPMLVVLGRLAAGILGRRRARRRLGLSVGDGDARRQGLLCQLAIGEPAGRGRIRRPARLCDRQPDGAGSGRRLGLAHPVLHRLRDHPVALHPPPVAARKRRSSQRAKSIRQRARSSRPWPPTGRSCSAAWRW